jgi:hypothetical protein
MKPVHVNFVNNACFQVNFFARREYGLTASWIHALTFTNYFTTQECSSGRHSVVGIVTGYRLEGSEFEIRCGYYIFCYPHPSRRALEPTHLHLLQRLRQSTAVPPTSCLCFNGIL